MYSFQLEYAMCLPDQDTGQYKYNHFAEMELIVGAPKNTCPCLEWKRLSVCNSLPVRCTPCQICTEQHCHW